MPESTYDMVQLIGTSNESWEKAAVNAVEQASKSLRDLRIAEIVELVCAAITRRAGCFSPRDYFANAGGTLQREAIMLSNSQRTA